MKCVECGGHVPVYSSYLCESCWTTILNEQIRKDEDKLIRVAVDIDGVLASKLENGVYPDDYMKKEALDGAIESLKQFKEWGYYVYLYSARYEEDREVTEKWLQDNGFGGLYEELILDKPKYDILIDDRAIRHDNWYKTMGTVMDLRHKGSWF